MISQGFMKTSFGSPEMGNYLRLMDAQERITEVVLIGLCTDICVISNALLLKAFLPEATICRCLLLCWRYPGEPPAGTGHHEGLPSQCGGW